jgi:hypothetical protein
LRCRFQEEQPPIACTILAKHQERFGLAFSRVLGKKLPSPNLGALGYPCGIHLHKIHYANRRKAKEFLFIDGSAPPGRPQKPDAWKIRRFRVRGLLRFAHVFRAN